MFRRFHTRWQYENDAGERITVPYAWAGELPEVVARMADDAGVTVRDAASATAQSSIAMSERAGQIAEIIDMLDDGEFLADGKPDVRAINKAMPERAEPVTADERNAIWAAMEEQVSE